jgi:hypothetical protein
MPEGCRWETREVLPPEHLARFIVDVIAMLNLRAIYQQYSALGFRTGSTIGRNISCEVEKPTTPFLHFGAGVLRDQESTLCYDKDATSVVAAWPSPMTTGDESIRRDVDEFIQHDHPAG